MYMYGTCTIDMFLFYSKHSFQSLQNECDRIQNLLDDEVELRKRTSADLKSSIEVVTSLKVELEEVREEKMGVLKQLETMKTEKQVTRLKFNVHLHSTCNQ